MAQEEHWERILKIRTSGTDESRANFFLHACEPTAYAVLERLAASGVIGRGNTLVDYGCGRGRAAIFLAHRTRCRAIGIEYDERIWTQAVRNSSGRAEFICMRAEAWSVPGTADRFYFFNPFSSELLTRVLRQIGTSLYATPRTVKLCFYYPTDDYLYILSQLPEPEEIDCRDLFGGNDPRERILIYTVESGDLLYRISTGK